MLSDVLLFASKTESKPISSSLTISHNCSCHVCFHCVMQLRTLMRHFFTHFLFCAPRAGLPRPMFPNAQPCFKTMACCSKLRVVRQSGWDGARLSSQIPCCLPILSVSRPVCLNFPDSQSWRVFPFFCSLFINFWRVLKKRLLVLAHLPVVGAQSQIFVKIIIVVFSFFPSFSSTNSVVAHQSHPCPSLLLSHEH